MNCRGTVNARARDVISRRRYYHGVRAPARIDETDIDCLAEIKRISSKPRASVEFRAHIETRVRISVPPLPPSSSPSARAIVTKIKRDCAIALIIIPRVPGGGRRSSAPSWTEMSRIRFFIFCFCFFFRIVVGSPLAQMDISSLATIVPLFLFFFNSFFIQIIIIIMSLLKLRSSI